MHFFGVCLSLLVLEVSMPALRGEVVETPVADSLVEADNTFSNERVGALKDRGQLEFLRHQLAEDLQPASLPGDTLGSAESHGGPGGHVRRKKRFWSSSESSSIQEEPDHSGYAAAMEALLSYYVTVQREGRRVVDIPDMTKTSTQRMLFFQVSKVLSVSNVKLRVPGELTRVTRVTAQALPSGDVGMSMNVRLGNFETWGRYDAKIGGVGPSGDFSTTIHGRVVKVTVLFRELPEGAGGEVPGRCSLQTSELSLVDRGSSDVPSMLASWAAEVEDVPTTLRIMKQLLDERLAKFPCNATFVDAVRRGYATV